MGCGVARGKLEDRRATPIKTNCGDGCVECSLRFAKSQLHKACDFPALMVLRCDAMRCDAVPEQCAPTEKRPVLIWEQGNRTTDKMSIAVRALGSERLVKEWACSRRRRVIGFRGEKTVTRPMAARGCGRGACFRSEGVWRPPVWTGLVVR